MFMDVLIHLDHISAHVILDSYVLAGNLRGGEGIRIINSVPLLY